MGVIESSAQVVLDYESLGQMYEDYGRAQQPDPFFDYYNVGGPNFDADEDEFVKLDQIKEAAPVNNRGAAAHQLQESPLSSRKLYMWHMFNMLPLNPRAQKMLRHPEKWTLMNGQWELERQMKDMATKHANTKKRIAAKTFFSQTMYIGAEGEILESASGAVISLATGLPTQNIGQIPGTGFGISGNIIDAAWDVASTKILTQLDKLTVAAANQGTEPPRHVWIHSLNKWWLRQNTEILAMYASGQQRLDVALSGDTFELPGTPYVFHFGATSYTDFSGNTNVPYIPLTRALITPDVGDWLATGNGAEDVPTTLDIAGSPSGALQSFSTQYGPFGYAVPVHNPIRYDVFAGDNWRFAFRNPASVFSPTVDF